MSTLLKLMKLDLVSAMKFEAGCRRENLSVPNSCKDTKAVVRSIISKFPEIGVKQDDATDIDTIQLLKKYIKEEKNREVFLQKIVTEEDVKALKGKKLKKLIKSKLDNVTSNKIRIAEIYLKRSNLN